MRSLPDDSSFLGYEVLAARSERCRGRCGLLTRQRNVARCPLSSSTPEHPDLSGRNVGMVSQLLRDAVLARRTDSTSSMCTSARDDTRCAAAGKPRCSVTDEGQTITAIPAAMAAWRRDIRASVAFEFTSSRLHVQRSSFKSGGSPPGRDRRGQESSRDASSASALRYLNVFVQEAPRAILGRSLVCTT